MEMSSNNFAMVQPKNFVVCLWREETGKPREQDWREEMQRREANVAAWEQ